MPNRVAHPENSLMAVSAASRDKSLPETGLGACGPYCQPIMCPPYAVSSSLAAGIGEGGVRFGMRSQQRPEFWGAGQQQIRSLSRAPNQAREQQQ